MAEPNQGHWPLGGSAHLEPAGWRWRCFGRRWAQFPTCFFTKVARVLEERPRLFSISAAPLSRCSSIQRLLIYSVCTLGGAAGPVWCWTTTDVGCFWDIASSPLLTGLPRLSTIVFTLAQLVLDSGRSQRKKALFLIFFITLFCHRGAASSVRSVSEIWRCEPPASCGTHLAC